MCSLWNVTSMINKTPKIMEHLLDRDPKIVFLTETWLKSDVSDVTALVKTYGYKLVHDRRKNRDKETGGGVGIMLKLGMKHKHVPIRTYSSFELTLLKLFQNNGKCVLLVSLYRILFVSVTVFLVEIVELFEYLASCPEEILLCGDINIHMDEDEIYANRFKDLLNTFNLTQHIDFPTHNLGHTLDIVATTERLFVSKFKAEENDVSGHFLIDFCLQFSPVLKVESEISYRKIHDQEKFQEEIIAKLQIDNNLPFSDNIKQYNDTLSTLLDEHAPVRRKKVKIVSNAPWFDSEYSNLRKLRRKAEKKFQKSGLSVHKDDFIRLRKQCTDLAHQKKCKYYGEKLEGAETKDVFKEINTLLDRKQESVLPEAKSDKELADSFMNFFNDKIKKIRSTFPPKQRETYTMFPTEATLTEFEPVTTDEIRKFVVSFGVKCSPEDPIPVSILKANSDTFIPIWTELVNISLKQGSMDCLKNAVVIPLIKEMDAIMDKDNQKNYRPVSNLLFLGKLIERVVAVRLNQHMTVNELNEESAYGYKSGHSTELLLLKAVNDLLLSCDNQMPSIVMLLDLSAAFDTVDQRKLLNILEIEIGIKGTALKWFESFLLNRTQKIKIGDSYSDLTNLLYGVAQGSVLGPPLFNIYIRPLRRYLMVTFFTLFGFADDHQLIKSFLPVFQIHALSSDIQYCFEKITDFMNEFFLKLNASKTKILVIMPPSLAHEIRIRGTFVNGACIRFVSSAKNLGVILDDELSFKKQIVKVVKSCFFTIRNLSRIKPFLTVHQVQIGICAGIFSLLDYCNSLYFGINEKLLEKLQSVQNAAVNLLRKKSGRRDESKRECMRKCHWLPIRERILFKMALLMHKGMHQRSSPMWLQNLIEFNVSERTLKLVQHPFRTSYGKRSFTRTGPRLWNLLPSNVKDHCDTEKFKSELKTYLFDAGDKVMRKLYET